jgi:tRNA threonylcarbamoyladenosine biosynthesis protein TsaB
MLILTIRTDKPEAELVLYNGTQKLVTDIWYAHRMLAETLHARITSLLRAQHKGLDALQGVVCFEGPGSFTGLRIGLTVGNALAYSYSIPIVATVDKESVQWQDVGIQRLLAGEFDKVALPHYGSPANVTTQKR